MLSQLALVAPLSRGPEQASTLQRASRLPKDMTLTSAGRDLQTALDYLRRERMIERFGRSMLHALGADAIIPDDVVDRLVEYAEAKTIRSVEDVQRQVGKMWGKMHEYGKDVVSVILR